MVRIEENSPKSAPSETYIICIVSAGDIVSFAYSRKVKNKAYNGKKRGVNCKCRCGDPHGLFAVFFFPVFLGSEKNKEIKSPINAENDIALKRILPVEQC